jgi:hypothetical protein
LGRRHLGDLRLFLRCSSATHCSRSSAVIEGRSTLSHLKARPGSDGR